MHSNQIKRVYKVLHSDVECRCKRHKWNCATEEYTDAEYRKHRCVVVAVHEVITFFTQPWLGILVDLALHDCKPRRKVSVNNIIPLKQVVRTWYCSLHEHQRDKKYSIVANIHHSKDLSKIKVFHFKERIERVSLCHLCGRDRHLFFAVDHWVAQS